MLLLQDHVEKHRAPCQQEIWSPNQWKGRHRDANLVLNNLTDTNNFVF